MLSGSRMHASPKRPPAGPGLFGAAQAARNT